MNSSTASSISELIQRILKLTASNPISRLAVISGTLTLLFVLGTIAVLTSPLWLASLVIMAPLLIGTYIIVRFTNVSLIICLAQYRLSGSFSDSSLRLCSTLCNTIVQGKI